MPIIDPLIPVPDFHPGDKASLFDFIWCCTTIVIPRIRKFMAEDFTVEWERETYKGDIVGLDHFTVCVEGVEVQEESMYGDIDDDALARIAAIYEPAVNAEQIIGTVS